ncbi:hypothetical protein SEMRO_4136_G353120.1 [Seminavis robusta]|uniref:DDE Tnp4 domain-containing protein n=1 Tax=Seminavis robusta TaxID=568900 RepID=A0A9N8HZT6_9STRA|nr:hypothetical protein SEMRO_4136_G353120.1 [Seminavis robusta]|eukprot:Sro4136_g353120.1 n/a (314) ;mRNA; r:1368-2309
MAEEVDLEALKLTPGEFLAIGLDITRGKNHWEYLKASANEDRFRKAFGAATITCSEIWNDLVLRQEITGKLKPRYLLLALRYLSTNDTQDDLMILFKIGSKHTIKDWTNLFVRKIQLLLKDKILSWDEVDEGYIFFMTADGTHCRIEEPRPFSTEWSSHKFGGKAALNYELGLSIHRHKLIWLFGPTPAGKFNDLEVARMKLFPTMRAYNQQHSKEPGLRILADNIFQVKSEEDIVSTDNEFDPKELARFKERAKSRQEKFNDLLKKWKVLDTVFRYEQGTDFQDQHKACFEAVTTVVCYSLDNKTSNLFESD